MAQLWFGDRMPCTKCSRLIPVSEFPRDKSRPDGRTYRCRECRSARTRPGPPIFERREKRALGLGWCRGCKAWCALGDVIQGRCRAHRAAEARARYATDDRYRAERRQHAHARKRDCAPIDTNTQEELIVEFGGRCAYCPAPATSWDHLRPVSRRGHSLRSNVVPCCLSCNSRKRDRDLDEWLDSIPDSGLNPALVDALALHAAV